MTNPPQHNPFARQVVGPSHSAKEIDLGEYSEDRDEEDSELVEEVVLSQKLRTNLVLRLQTFPAPDDDRDGLNIKGHICHARRSPIEDGESWESFDYLNLAKLKQGEYIKLYLGSTHLRAIFTTLLHRYRLTGGLEKILAEFNLSIVDLETSTVLSGREHESLATMLQNDPEFWDHVLELDTANALEMKLSHRAYQRKKLALNEFGKQMALGFWEEEDWQRFFSRNEWIFGYSISYQYVSIVEQKAELGGKNIRRRGGSQVDYLLETLGDARFTVLLDIKKPGHSLVGNEYRGRAHFPGKHLVGGTAQLQNYLHIWATKGSQDNANDEEIDAGTFNPKGVLVIGHLGELDTADKRKSFELYRRNLGNPAVITFDELYERASYILDRTEEDALQAGTGGQLEATSSPDTWDDVPF